jgi:hypothetical protein
MVRVLKKLVLKAFGPSLGVNQMWTKKNDHAPKSEGADFFDNMSKKGSFEKKIKSDHSFISLELHLSSFIVECVKDVASKSSHNNFYKYISDLICTCSV